MLDRIRSPVERRQSGGRPYRQPNRYGRPCVRTLAVRRDLTAVLLHDVSRDRQTEPEPAVTSRRSTVRLPESIEHVRQEILRDPNARIANPQLQPVPLDAAFDRDASILRRELQSVCKHVVENLVKPFRIPFDWRKFRRDLTGDGDPLRLGDDRGAGDDGFEELRD